MKNKQKQNKTAAGGYSGISPKDVKLVGLDWNTSAGPKQKGQPGRSEFRLFMIFDVNNTYFTISTPLLSDSDDATEKSWIFNARHALVQFINKGKSDKLLDADNNFKPVTNIESTNLRVTGSISCKISKTTKLGNLGKVATALRSIANK